MVLDLKLLGAAPGQGQPFEEYEYDPLDPPTNWFSFDDMQSWQDVQSFPFDAQELEACGARNNPPRGTQTIHASGVAAL